MDLHDLQRKIMVRGLVSAAAVKGMASTVDYEELDRVAAMLDGHQLDCTCAVCMAYVSAETPAAGLLAAMMANAKE